MPLIDATTSTPTPRLTPRSVTRPPHTNPQADFAAVLGRGVDRGGSPEQQARDAAEQFVSVGLVQPLLAQLRSTNQAAPPFAPSNAEKQFQSLMDASIARQITHAERFPLVDWIAAMLIKRLHNGAAADTPTAKSPPPAPTPGLGPLGGQA